MCVHMCIYAYMCIFTTTMSAFSVACFKVSIGDNCSDRCSHFAQAMTDKTVRRAGRDEAVACFNSLADSCGVEEVGYRPKAAEVQALFGQLLACLSDDDLDKFREAREKWCSNGGCELPQVTRQRSGEGGNEDGTLAGHRTLQQEFYKTKKGAFRLQSKAFMMTFNSILFVASAEFWVEFVDWVKDRCQTFGAKFWSCTMELSLRSEEVGRVHLHAYWSWTTARGVDHDCTDQWCFRGVRPRVDVNSEHRGPYEWKRACQHGHWYVQVQKLGTLESATNYAPWENDWIPEAWWATALWKQHKLDHETYLRISMQLRDGHDRRKACVDAVIAAESAVAHADEQAAARQAIARRSLPFKPLHPDIERFKMQHAEIDDRYVCLVLWGPSRTGKSRLARSLYGDDRTLVVDIQHALHPDLRGFRRGHHLCLLLDEMSSPEFIAKNKKLLQAHVDGAKLGQSATQLYSYNVFLWRVPIIITTNNWNLNDLEAVDREWVESNCIPVHINEPVWASGLGAAAATRGPSTPRSQPASQSKRNASTLTPGVSPLTKHAGLCCSACGQRLPAPWQHDGVERP